MNAVTATRTLSSSRKRESESEEEENDEPPTKKSKPLNINHQRRTENDADAHPATRGPPKSRMCIVPGCLKYRQKNRMCKFHNANQVNMESATSTLSSKPESDDDEQQAKKPNPSQGAPEHRKCTFPGCKKYRFKNRMCRYHNKPETAATTGKKGGELQLYCMLVAIMFFLHL